jgi:hypothetical protein
MNRCCGVLLVVLALCSCRTYDYYSKVADTDGLVPGDQFARYGREQAQAVAIAREFARAHQGDSPEAIAKQAEAAVTYARGMPDVADVVADPQGYRLTVYFKSGWRAGLTPLNDGKSGAETPGIATPSPGAAPASP